MTLVILYLLGVVAVGWYGLKFADWIHALRYERRKARKTVPASPGPKTGTLPDGRVVVWVDAPVEDSPSLTRLGLADKARLTPDRPSPIRQEIDALTGRGEATHYPRGS